MRILRHCGRARLSRGLAGAAAVALAAVVPVRADELSDLRAQADSLQWQNKALMQRIDEIARLQNAAAPDPRPQSLAAPEPGAAATHAAPVPGGAGRSPGVPPVLPPGSGADSDSANATASGNSGSTVGVPTVQEQRTASTAPAAAAIGGTPPIPSASALSVAGITLSGEVDLGVAYQTHGTPLSDSYGSGLEYLISRNSNRPQVSLAPNALSYSNVGLTGNEPLAPGLAAVFNLQTSFLPTAGTLANGPASLVRNNGVALARQGSYGDSNRAGQAFNTVAYAGLSSPRLGTLTFGRQTTLTSDGVVAYDPMFAANAFSVIGYQSVTAGMGDSEDARLDSVVKYLVNYGPVHGGGLVQLNGANARSVNADNNGGRAAWEAAIGAEYAGLDVDAIYSRLYDAVSAAPLSAAQALVEPSGSLAATISDNRTFMLLAKYRIGRLQVFAGWENILYSNPRDPLGPGSTSIGGIPLSVINNTAYTNARLFQVYWTGARYALSRKLSIGLAYYRQHQSSYSGTRCADASLASCRGDLNAGSVLLDYRVSPRFDIYAGAMLSTVSGGLASGFLNNTTIDPTAGARFAF